MSSTPTIEVKKISGNMTYVIVGVIVIFAGVTIFGVPLIDVSYQESYNVTVPYEVREEYTVEVPYEDLENYTVQVPQTKVESRERIIAEDSDFSLDGKHYTYWRRDISKGRYVHFSIECRPEVDLYICTPNQFDLFKAGLESYEEKLRTREGYIRYIVPENGTYYFIICNYRNDIKVNIYSSKIKEYWGEEVTHYIVETHNRTVTKYRTETRYKTVTKERTETQLRTITKRVTIWESITVYYPIS